MGIQDGNGWGDSTDPYEDREPTAGTGDRNGNGRGHPSWNFGDGYGYGGNARSTQQNGAGYIMWDD